MQINSQVASLFRYDTQAEQYIAVPGRLSRIEVRVKPILDPQDLRIRVRCDGSQTGCHGGHVVKDDGLATDVQQARCILKQKGLISVIG